MNRPPSPKSLATAGVLAGTLAACAAWGQPLPDYSKPFVCTSQLGFRTAGEKLVTLLPGAEAERLPEAIPFLIQPIGSREPRANKPPAAWDVPGNVFRYPIDISAGPFAAPPDPAKERTSFTGARGGSGVLRRLESRWGTVWRGDFSAFASPGVYQIEVEAGFSAPFVVEEYPYERLERGYLVYLRSQRSGVEVPGVRPVENADDARLDSDESVYLPVAGGWNDAGDHRKWMFLTLPNLEALAHLARRGHPAFRRAAIDEILWGNAYFHHMVADDGTVYEDVGAGRHRGAADHSDWWNENHPGVTASGDHGAHDASLSGNERHVRTWHNPLVQAQFVRHQAIAATALRAAGETAAANNSLVLADKAWKRLRRAGDDRRTIFVAEELLAACELIAAGAPTVGADEVARLADELLARQEPAGEGLGGYFTERGAVDAYRSVAFAAEPALALLRVAELHAEGQPGLAPVAARARAAVRLYVEQYLLADARSNPFGIPPYGVYFDPPRKDAQSFRDAGRGRGVRTFLHLFAERPIPHGVGASHLGQAYLMARAARLERTPDWGTAAERVLHWALGHNPAGLCTNQAVGFRHVLPANFVNYRVPDAMSLGFLGRPDDTPYVETTNAIEWSTQEIWDIPYVYTIGIIEMLRP